MRNSPLRPWALCLAVLCAIGNLSTLSTASLIARRGSLPVGQYCDSSDQCYTGLCDYRSLKDSYICVLQNANGTCFENDVCGSQNCSNGKCVASPVLGTCDYDLDCAGDGKDFGSGRECAYNNKCYVSEGFTCNKTEECFQGTCNKGICRLTIQPPNAQCFVDSECESGKCIPAEQKPLCVGKDGSAQFYCGAHCGRFSLGHQCRNNGECSKGLCVDHKCVPGKTGDSCVSDFQCTAPGALCGSAGKCISPGNNTLFPQEHCLKDAQCYSGKCVDDLPLTNKYDEHKELPIGSPQDPSRCDYLKPGQEGKCRSFVDCNGGICKNQACVLGTDGDACLYNQHCKNVCGLDGKCYSPPSNHSLGAGQPCTNSKQCATSDGCKASSATRPVPGTSGTMRKVTETICTGSNPNGACVQDSDCAAGACRNSTCKALPVGTSCSTDTQCSTYLCQRASGAKGKTCQALPFRMSCTDNSECYSDKCTASVCDGHGCLENRNCEAVLVGGSCRSSEDCDTSARCTSGKQCKLNNGEDCRSNSDCVSGACKDDVCMKSSTSTKTTATSSKSTTSTTTKKTTSPTTTSKTTATSKRTTSTMV